MQTETIAPKVHMIAVSKSDLIEVWSLLEKMVVSHRRIGSRYAVPDSNSEQNPEQRRGMLEALDEFLSPELAGEMTRARRLLVNYLPDDEMEHLSEHVIRYWGDDDGSVAKDAK